MQIEERDPHTGYLTTGHEWNGITELNRPVPKVIWLFLLGTFLFSVIWWVLMPAWPLGRTYTPGLLGVDQRERIASDLRLASSKRAEAINRIDALPFNEIVSDPGLMKFVRETGRTIYGDNCAMCHGPLGQGGPGFPNLADRAWLWGGDPETVSETLRVGINVDHPDTRDSQMLAFGHEGILDRDAIRNVAHYVSGLGQNENVAATGLNVANAGHQVFQENCASCHGEEGRGSQETGAPDLTDGYWIYGGDVQSIIASIYAGRRGQMPAWETRLTKAERKLMALYVLELGNSSNGRGE